jgi:quinol monooxygenase YgiN
MIIRMFDTAMDPEDVEYAKELFRDTVVAAFENFEGCHGIELFLGLEKHSKDLVDVAAISRWDSMAAIEKAIKGPDYDGALDGLKKLFQQTPIVRHFETID